MRADVVLANNVMAHMPDVNGVMEGVRLLLAPTGVFVMETPYIHVLRASRVRHHLPRAPVATTLLTALEPL